MLPAAGGWAQASFSWMMVEQQERWGPPSGPLEARTELRSEMQGAGPRPQQKL